MRLTERNKRESMRDYALRMITENIVNLELKPGSMVSEGELAAELGLSRGPIREALIELSRVKIVEVYPQRGISIAMIDYDLIEEARFMRETLECAVVERCCQRGIIPKLMSALQENVKLQQFYKANQDESTFEKILDLDYEFHRTLFLNANAAQIHQFINSMLVHFDRVRSMAVVALKDVEFVSEHVQILEAIKNKAADIAKELTHKHINRYQVDKKMIIERYPEYIKKSRCRF